LLQLQTIEVNGPSATWAGDGRAPGPLQRVGDITRAYHMRWPIV